MIRKWLQSPIATLVLAALAVGFILYGGINAIKAAPRIQSDWYGAQVELDDIDVAIMENGEQRHGDGDLLLGLLAKDEEFQIGKLYKEELSVKNMLNTRNNGTEGNRYGNDNGDDGVRIIPEYVRVTVYKYWTDADGNKNRDLDPDLIELNYVTDGGWTIDKDSSTSERTVLYYATILPVDEESSIFADSLKISNDVRLDKKYKDCTFHIEAVVDAVQTHNGSYAMLGAWGNNTMIEAVPDDAE